MELMLLVFIFVMATFLGTELIAKVPSQLHTPLMSATNAISGITIVGAVIACAVNAVSFNSQGSLGTIISFIAIILAAINVIGGYAVTQRMLGMFNKKEEQSK